MTHLAWHHAADPVELAMTLHNAAPNRLIPYYHGCLMCDLPVADYYASTIRAARDFAREMYEAGRVELVVKDRVYCMQVRKIRAPRRKGPWHGFADMARKP